MEQVLLDCEIKQSFKKRTYCPLNILTCKYDVDKDNGGLFTVQEKQEGVSKLPGKIMESQSWFF